MEVTIVVHTGGKVVWKETAPLPPSYHAGRGVIGNMGADAMAAAIMAGADAHTKELEE